jgi:ubiquinone/menaquinone biosynthesis C-methylase UbiE
LTPDCREPAHEAVVPLPKSHYLNTHYWWAYVHPRSVWVFERPWLVNLILFGNYGRLRDAAIAALEGTLEGRLLQVACAYGNLTPRLAERLEPAGSLEVVDILPVQLDNLRGKLAPDARVRLACMDSSALVHEDASFDAVLLFFLLHEQPVDVRRRTLSEALRVLKPGGRLVVVDYARPRWWNPVRWLYVPILAKLEPFAPDLWREPVSTWLPEGAVAAIEERRYAGGLYQRLVITRR